ncbi:MULTISPECIES: DEAD/DEAH box helicase [Pseudidiomarina]|uniref:AAA domain-containing protein n=2 Tax=Pseudidiomarina TaxID=2800384 RepID=A0A368V283_9GAMM|nr:MULTISPECIES: ATP-binding protein [Pseudidiomarina]PWW14226.1 AAA domain-containing protein [Pseudidiomarina maritima]RBP92040.1 AAA domain-containing protein [Pseudidiomarina tainanensis]RCW33804.1 AAA domain-containing protein [Pseudidiomarina tainanensis]
MTISINNKIPFWREELTADYPHVIPILINAQSRVIDEKITSELTETDYRNKLKQARRGILSKFTSSDGKTIYRLLIGELALRFSPVNNKDGYPRFWQSGQVKYANHDDRARALKNGVVLNFNGVEYFTGPEFNKVERYDRFYNSGEYVEKLVALLTKPLLASAAQLNKKNSSTHRAESLSDEKLRTLELLTGYINAEYQVDCLNEQHEPSFFYQSKKASSIRHVIRQFYDLTLAQEDYERILTKQPKLLALDVPESHADDVAFEVVDFEPEAGKPIIQVSVQRQLLAKDIPNSGLLKIVAHPILKKIRSEIVTQLNEERTQNPWLLGLLANEIALPEFKSQPITLNSGAFPPTPSQQKAIEAGVATPDYSLVLGPPGTGKTTVILEWVRHFVREGKRVLITSQNNKAVDNVLERLATEEGFECLRIGNESKISSSLDDILLDNKLRELQQRLFEGNKALSDFFVRATHYLTQLTNNIQSIETHLDAITTAREQASATEKVLAKLNDVLRNKDDDLTKINSKLSSLTAELTDFEANPPTGLKKLFFGDFFYRLKKRSRQKSIAQLSRTKVSIECDKKNNLVEFEQHQQKLTQVESIITEHNSALACFDETHPGNYEDYITIPRISEFQAEKTISLRDRIALLNTVVSDWYVKISQEREQSLYPLLLEHINVVGATCIGINTRQMFRDIDFDVVIVDEAGQIQAHNLIVPLSRCAKAILVGDHKQIGPIASDEIIDEIKLSGIDYHELDLYRKSLFEVLWEQSPPSRKFMLDTQFRCPSEISDFVSEAFYDNSYYAGSNKKNSKPLLRMFNSPMVWLDTSVIKNNREQRSQNGFSGNMTETNIVVEVLRRAVKATPELLESREVAIIVPYRAHVQQIQKRIKKLQQEKELPEFSFPLHELVASVDSFQGQERDLVIFAFSRSNTYGNVGFLKDWQRINVALTRAKKQLVIVGNTQTVTHIDTRRSNNGDITFKQAMKLLVQHLTNASAIIEGFRFFPKTATKKATKTPKQPPKQKVKQCHE